MAVLSTQIYAWWPSETFRSGPFAFPTSFLCVSDVFPMRFRRLSYVFPTSFRCVSVVFPMRFRRPFDAFPIPGRCIGNGTCYLQITEERCLAICQLIGVKPVSPNIYSCNTRRNDMPILQQAVRYNREPTVVVSIPAFIEVAIVYCK